MRMFLLDRAQNVKSDRPLLSIEMDYMTIVKIVELVASSPVSWEEATKNALAEAAKTIRGIKSIYVKRCTAKVEKNKIVEYRAVVKIAFLYQKEP
jgi:dodecin